MRFNDIRPTHWFSPVVLLLILSGIPALTSADKNAELWKLLQQQDHIALIRHALAPGFGDPDHFDVNDCTTQRNLSDTGREQARRIGDLFRANGIHKADVFTSQWCRCRETAALMDIGTVTELPALNSFFQNYASEEPQTIKIHQWLEAYRPETPLVLVTHQVNIRALVGQGTRSGEIVIAKRAADGTLEVVASIPTD